MSAWEQLQQAVAKQAAEQEQEQAAEAARKKPLVPWSAGIQLELRRAEAAEAVKLRALALEQAWDQDHEQAAEAVKLRAWALEQAWKLKKAKDAADLRAKEAKEQDNRMIERWALLTEEADRKVYPDQTKN